MKLSFSLLQAIYLTQFDNPAPDEKPLTERQKEGLSKIRVDLEIGEDRLESVTITTKD